MNRKLAVVTLVLNLLTLLVLIGTMVSLASTFFTMQAALRQIEENQLRSHQALSRQQQELRWR